MTLQKLIKKQRKIALDTLTIKDDPSLIKEVIQNIDDMTTGLFLYIARYPESINHRFTEPETERQVSEQLRMIGVGWREAKKKLIN